MAGTAGEIFLSGMNYQGVSELGGFTFAPLNTKPLEDLGRYTMLYKKSLFDQRQKDADDKILELAKIADININLLRGKDKDEVLKSYNELMTAGTEFARKQAKNPQEKVQQHIDWQLKYKAVNDKFVTGKARAIKYQAELDKINSSTDDADTKAVKTKQLDQVFDKTPVTEQFSSLPQYATSTIEVPVPIETEINVIDIGDNENVNVKGVVYLPSENSRVINMTEIGLSKLYPKPGTSEFDKNKPQSEIQATIDSEAKIWSDMTDIFNEALQTPDGQGGLLYYKKDSTGAMILDDAKFKKDFPLLAEPLKSMQALTKYSIDHKTQFASGVFTDKGFKYKIPTNITAESFDAGIIDLNKGKITTHDLLQGAVFSKFKGDKFGKTIQETDNLLQRKQQAIQWYNATHQGETAPTGETRNFMDLTGYTGTLTTADIAAIDPTLVQSESGVFKLNDKGEKATFKILPNGDVEVNYNDGKAKTNTSPEKKPTIKVINKSKYQQESITVTQTVLKDRKGEQGNPFTFTGLQPTKDTKDDDSKLTQAEYYKKYKKFRK